MLKKQSDLKPFIILFVSTLITRVLFKVISGYNNFELFGDALRYDMLSDRILSHNFDLDIVAFIPAPLYPYFIALCKIMSATYWQVWVVSIQFILIGFSSFYIYKITKLLFTSSSQAYFAAFLYLFYPMTMWFNFTICQETVFQSTFIFFVYFFLLFIKESHLKHLWLSAVWFAIAFLTKSHITILLPFIALIIFFKSDIKKSLSFFLILFIFAIPHGFVNYKIHSVFTLSSYGSNSLLLAGHSDETFPCLMDPHFAQDGCNLNVVFHKPYVYKEFGNINGLPIYKRNKMWRKAVLAWIKSNPKKFIALKVNGLKRFLLPGLDHRIYDTKFWLISLIMGLLIYIPAYVIIYKKAKENLLIHSLTISVILNIFVIFIIFYPQQRFRLITLEPLLIIYASYFYWQLIKKGIKKAKTLNAFAP